MRALPVADASWAGIVCFYAIVHLAPADLPAAFTEFRRVLRPGGRVVVAFHVGNVVAHRDEWWEQPVRLDFIFHGTDHVVAALREAGSQPSGLRRSGSELTLRQDATDAVAACAAMACTARWIRLGARTFGPSCRNAVSESGGSTVR